MAIRPWLSQRPATKVNRPAFTVAASLPAASRGIHLGRSCGQERGRQIRRGQIFEYDVPACSTRRRYPLGKGWRRTCIHERNEHGLSTRCWRRRAMVGSPEEIRRRQCTASLVSHARCSGWRHRWPVGWSRSTAAQVSVTAPQSAPARAIRGERNGGDWRKRVGGTFGVAAPPHAA